MYYESVYPGGILPEDVIWLRTEIISKKDKPSFISDGA